MNDDHAGDLSRLLTDMSTQSAEIRKGQGRIERMLVEILAKLSVGPVVVVPHEGKIGG